MTAIAIPLEVMRLAVELTELLGAVAADGLAAAVSDAGSGVFCAIAAAEAAHLNVKINAKELGGPRREAALANADRLSAALRQAADRIFETVRARLDDAG